MNKRGFGKITIKSKTRILKHFWLDDERQKKLSSLARSIGASEVETVRLLIDSGFENLKRDEGA